MSAKTIDQMLCSEAITNGWGMDTVHGLNRVKTQVYRRINNSIRTTIKVRFMDDTFMDAEKILAAEETGEEIERTLATTTTAVRTWLCWRV